MRRILIVDDEELIRKGLQSMLQRYKKNFYDIYLCSDGEQAEKILKEISIDIVITDVRMPKVDGMELINYIKSFHKETAIIILSGYDDFSYAKEAIRCGVKEYLLKPISREKLYECMENIEKEKRKTEEYENAYYANQLRFLVKAKVLNKDFVEKIKKTVDISIFSNYYIGVYTINNLKSEISSTAFIDSLKSNKSDSIICFFDSDGYLVVIANNVNLLKNILKNMYNKNCKVGISKQHKSIESVKDAYFEAKEAFKYRIITKNNVISFTDVETRTRKYNFSKNKIDLIMNMLGTGRTNDIEKGLDELFSSDNINKYNIDYFVRINSIFKEKMKQIDKKFICEEIYDYHDVYEYLDKLKRSIVAIDQDLVDERKDASSNPSVKKAISYVNINFNKDINLAMIANKVNLNYTYFCELFKSYTGDTFVNYVKKLRINKAKEMLVNNTDYKIYEIAKRVGYEDSKQFAKTFRKITGISPQEYRNKYFIDKDGVRENV